MAVLKSSLILSLVDRVSGPARGIMGTFDRVRRASNGFAESQRRLAAPILTPTAGIAGMAATYFGLTSAYDSTVGAAMRLEDSMASIRKVMDFKVPGQFEEMKTDLVDMSKVIPITADGLAEIAAAAGQANVPMAEILEFTELTAKASTAWDMAAGETGDTLAKLKTGLSMSVEETGLLADAINHLSNNSASSAPNLVRFSRGLIVGKQAGFAAQQTLALGAAMIGAGYEAEVAETSFRNMVRALTGGGTTARERNAFKKLGFDAKKVARDMQEDAVGTTLKVFDAINKLPEHEQGAISTMLFGSEARALPALVANMEELRRTLGLVATEADYAGSAQREFEEASKRTSNNLQLLKNSMTAIGTSLGASMLGPLNDFFSGLKETLDTLPQRVGIFDQMGASLNGFLAGLGYAGESPLADLVGSLRDGLFGSLETFQADIMALAELSNDAREIGRWVKELALDFFEFVGKTEDFFGLDTGFISSFFGEMAGWGFKLMVTAVSVGILATSIMKLGRALLFLSGASTLIGGAKWLRGLWGSLQGMKDGKTVAAPKTTGPASSSPKAPPVAPVAAIGGGSLFAFLAAFGSAVGLGAYGLGSLVKNAQDRDFERDGAKGYWEMRGLSFKESDPVEMALLKHFERRAADGENYNILGEELRQLIQALRHGVGPLTSDDVRGQREQWARQNYPEVFQAPASPGVGVNANQLGEAETRADSLAAKLNMHGQVNLDASDLDRVEVQVDRITAKLRQAWSSVQQYSNQGQGLARQLDRSLQTNLQDR